MIVVTKDLYTLRSWEGQDTESLTLHLNNKKIWDNCRDGLPHHEPQCRNPIFQFFLVLG